MDIINFMEIEHTYISIWNISSNDFRNRIIRNKTYNEIDGILGRNRSRV